MNIKEQISAAVHPGCSESWQHMEVVEAILDISDIKRGLELLAMEEPVTGAVVLSWLRRYSDIEAHIDMHHGEEWDAQLKEWGYV